MLIEILDQAPIATRAACLELSPKYWVILRLSHCANRAFPQAAVPQDPLYD